jgi:tRNA(Ile)-lysidine synthase
METFPGVAVGDDFLERLRAALDRSPFGNAPRFAIALSGGIDSMVLLAAMRCLVPESRLVALHVDHGLHASSAQWTEHCRRYAAAQGVAFACRRVQISAGNAHGLEAAAREARYAALAALIAPDDVVLTAHHGDDQLETMLLRMLRGAGVRGLTGIREFAVFPPGYLARPLLDFTRAEIAAQAERLGLVWIEDPANREQRFDRSFLRTRVIPALRERWPAAQRSSTRLGRQMAEAEQLLEGLAERDAVAITDLRRVACAVLRDLSVARQNNLLRFLIRRLDLPTAGAAHLEQLRAAIVAERRDAAVHVAWPGADARIYRDHLYLMPRLPPTPPARSKALLTPRHEWRGDGCLKIVPTDEAGFPDEWVQAGIDIRLRAGGERFRPSHHAHRKTLKHWFQENGVVPWMRDRIPLLYRDGTLIGIADLSISEEARAQQTVGSRWRAVWTDHPPVR